MPLRKKTGLPISAPATPAPTRALTADALAAPPPLAVPLVKQTQNQWCWAACTAMIARFLGLPEPKQCELANFLFSRTNCCQAPASSPCNRPAQYVDIISVYNHIGIAGIGPDYPLLPNTVVAELNAGRPFEVALNWAGGGGHVAIVYGYTNQGLVLIQDPHFGTLSMVYNALAAAYGHGWWVASYGRFVRS